MSKTYYLIRVFLNALLFASVLSLATVHVKAENSSHGEKKSSGDAKHGSEKDSSKKNHGGKARKIRAHKDNKSHDSKVSDSDIKHPRPLSGERELFGESGIPEDEIIQAVLVLDNSRSMLKTDPNRIRDQGAKLFLQFLEPSDYFAIVQFAEDARVVVPFTQLSKATGEDISDSLKSIVNDGNFTDFLSGIEIAQSLFEESTEIKAKNKAIIVISDGQNDPNPTKHTKEEVADEILKKRIPTMKKKGIRIYTLAMSQFADQQFLAEISKTARGLSWYADSMNEVHRVFSDLFLALKKPQVLELTKEGFEIDSSSNEATFIISRTHENDSITVLDPSDHEYINSDFPSVWKWFRGELFDIITVPNPLPGRWIIKSSDKTQSSQPVSGYAKLITKLNLEYSWPQGVLDVGTTAILKARLVGDPAILEDQQIKNLIFYSYKIINVKTGAVYAQGKLLDSGSQGDEKALDNIFSNSITFNEDGEYKLFVSCIGPTFSRQAHVPVVISRGMISLEKIEENTFAQTPEYLLVKLHGDATELKSKKINVIAEIIGAEGQKPYGVKLSEDEKEANEFQLSLSRFKSGHNKVYVVISGVDGHGEEVRAKSEELDIHVGSNHSHESHAEHGEVPEHDGGGKDEQVQEEDVLVDEDEVHEEELEKEEPATWHFGIVGPALSIILGFLCARYFIKSSKQEKGVSIVLRPVYEVEPSLQQRLNKIFETASKTRRRQLKPEEIEVFALLPELQQALAEISSNAPEFPTGEGSSDTDSSEETSESAAQSPENDGAEDSNQREEVNEPSEVSEQPDDVDKTVEIERDESSIPQAAEETGEEDSKEAE